jgi:hypothetical protein
MNTKKILFLGASLFLACSSIAASGTCKTIKKVGQAIADKADDVVKDIEHINAKVADKLDVSETTSGIGLGLASAVITPIPAAIYGGIKAGEFIEEESAS